MADPDGDAQKSDIDTVRDLQLQLMQAEGAKRRGQHPKAHGVVWARFEVLADIPGEYRVGLFAKPAVYTAYIRFSNGSQQDDSKSDLHGMAIKLTGVPGQKILEAESSALTHDFVMADKPVFFIRDGSEYARFMEDFARTAPRGKPPLEFMGWLTLHHLRDLPVMLGFRNPVQDSPLAAQYWSQVPYAFGLGDDMICRYSAVPQPGNLTAAILEANRDGEYLRRAMADQLTAARKPAVFDFTVQMRTDATPDVIDNPTVVWDTPEQRVAVITIPPQTFDSPGQMRFCENLSYTPWHALAEHRPVGQINEIRKSVYVASSELRHATNQAPRIEPTGSEHWSFNMRLSNEELTTNIDDDFKAVVAKLQNTFNYMAASIQHGRATHTYGVVAKGEARCIVPSEFPANETFVLGKVFPIVLRHSSPGGRADDRARDGVAASIKFFEPGSSTDGDGFYDILMNAGRQLFVRSIRDFSTFVHTPDDERIKLVQQGIMLEPQLIEAYRIRGSFTDFRYYTWVCFEFIDSKGTSKYVRFRLINHDRGEDRGLPKTGFRANGRPSMEPVPDDTRAPDFLRKDFLYRVKYSDVRYILQAQFRDVPNPPVVNHELFDPSQAWNEYWYPWMDMFDIRITESVEDYAAAVELEMNPNRSPQCIKIPLATSPDHYASLGHARAIIYPGARAVRATVPPPQNN
jgi:catalase